MEMASWRDDITQALTNLGGAATLDQVYAEILRIRPGPHPASLEAIIRRTLEEHSSDSASFRGPDLFRSVDGLGRGRWGLRTPSAEPEGGWGLSPGARLRRSDIHSLYGGAARGGIEPSGRTPNILIFSQPEQSEHHTYRFDGWAAADLLHYTGEGQRGDQKFTFGNRAIRDHVVAGRALRVFRAEPPWATYLGEFRVDSTEPYFLADSPDPDGFVRQVIVFRLRPVGKFVDGGLPPAARRPSSRRSSLVQLPPPLTAGGSVEIGPEAVNVDGYISAPPDEPTEALRREAALVGRYQIWLNAHGHSFARNRVLIAGEVGTLYTDLFDKTAGELIEAKASASRASVRTGLGQLLDYARFVDHQRLSLLLPGEPRPDLLDLLRAHGCGCIWETQPGKFARRDP